MVTLGVKFYYPPRRERRSGILGDVDSHLPANHPYTCDDPITTVHESTHGINASFRYKYKTPGFYLLHDQAILLNEPDLTLSDIDIPPPLRGAVHDRYLVKARRWWNEQPSYVWDEYTAYTNGADARAQFGRSDRIDTVEYAVEFLVYSSYIPYMTGDTTCREFLRGQNERVMGLCRRAQASCSTFIALQTHPALCGYRDFLRNYYGEMWCKIWLHI